MVIALVLVTLFVVVVAMVMTMPGKVVLTVLILEIKNASDRIVIADIGFLL